MKGMVFPFHQLNLMSSWLMWLQIPQKVLEMAQQGTEFC